MTSRERILNACNYKPTDRIPLDLGGHRSSGISAIAYARLKKHLGIRTGNIYVYDMIQQLAIVEPEVMDYFGVDTVELGRTFLKDDREWKEWVLPDGTPCLIPAFIQVEKIGDDWHLFNDKGLQVGIQKKGVLYFEQTRFPLMERGIEQDDFSDLEEMLNQTMWCCIGAPGTNFALDDAGLQHLGESSGELRKSTDRAIIGLFGGNLFETPQFLYRADNYLMALALYPEKVIELSEKLTAMYLQKLEKWLGACGKYIDIILFGDDFGSNQAPLISPEMYRLYYKPYHTRMWKRVKELANVKIQLHSCGAIEPLLEDMIEAGLDMVNPVQISAEGMSAKYLKNKYSGRLTFWGGGCDTRHILPNAQPEQVTAHVRQQINDWGRQGGFVFQQVHNIMANVPPENICAMLKGLQDT